jgi:ribonuclease R
MAEPPRYREWLVDTALHSSERERLAEGAERDSVELKKIQFMERHVGEIFDGVITGVEVFGFFVELARYFVSGLVHVSSLGDDYYQYLENEFSLVGSSSGRKFTLGDPVRVQVLSVNKELRQIDFLIESMVEDPDAGKSPRERIRKAKGEFEGTRKSRRPAAKARTPEKPRRPAGKKPESEVESGRR